MPKVAKQQMSEDEIRIKILEYFYNVYKNPRGMSSCKILISKITSDLKKQGIDKKEVIRNMLYLIDTGWIRKETEESQFFTGKQRITTKKDFYKISSDGIDFFEKSSKFQKANKLAGINITNVQGVVAIGNNNYIRNEFTELFESLEDLGRQIRISNKLNDEEKINYQAEIETIKSQLIKPKPDKDIVRKAWDAIKAVATINGIISFYNKAKPFIESLLK